MHLRKMNNYQILNLKNNIVQVAELCKYLGIISDKKNIYIYNPHKKPKVQMLENSPIT